MKRANRRFRTRGLSEDPARGFQDIAAETRKRVNARRRYPSTSIRLVRHRINGTPQFPSAPLSPALSCVSSGSGTDRERDRAPVRPCHFVWQDSNDRRSIIRRSREGYSRMTITSTYSRRERESLARGYNCLFFHSVFERSSTCFLFSSLFPFCSFFSFGLIRITRLVYLDNVEGVSIVETAVWFGSFD